MYQDSNNEISQNDFSIKELKKILIETNGILLEEIKKRYMEDLFASMLFFIFNEVCKKIQIENKPFEENTEKTTKVFFNLWRDKIKKISKKELLEINNKLKTDTKMSFLGAISNFSLPTTEDYQIIYDKALADTQKFFEKNTENN